MDTRLRRRAKVPVFNGNIAESTFHQSAKHAARRPKAAEDRGYSGLLFKQERGTPFALAVVSSLSLVTRGLFIFHGLQRP
jgi:hypothetical protein